MTIKIGSFISPRDGQTTKSGTAVGDSLPPASNELLGETVCTPTPQKVEEAFVKNVQGRCTVKCTINCTATFITFGLGLGSGILGVLLLPLSPLGAALGAIVGWTIGKSKTALEESETLSAPSPNFVLEGAKYGAFALFLLAGMAFDQAKKGCSSPIESVEISQEPETEVIQTA